MYNGEQMLKGCACMSVEFLDMFRIRNPRPFQLHVCKPTVIFDFCVISSLKFYFCWYDDGDHIHRGRKFLLLRLVSNGPSFAI